VVDWVVDLGSAVIGSARVGLAGVGLAEVGSAEVDFDSADFGSSEFCSAEYGSIALSVVEPEVGTAVREVNSVVDGGFVVFGFIDSFEEIECFLKFTVSELAVFEKTIIAKRTHRLRFLRL